MPGVDGCDCAAVVGLPHIMVPVAPVEPVVAAAAWLIIEHASAGVAANPAAKARAMVVVLMALLLLFRLVGTRSALLLLGFRGDRYGQNYLISAQAAILRHCSAQAGQPAYAIGYLPFFLSQACISAISRSWSAMIVSASFFVSGSLAC